MIPRYVIRAGGTVFFSQGKSQIKQIEKGLLSLYNLRRNRVF